MEEEKLRSSRAWCPAKLAELRAISKKSMRELAEIRSHELDGCPDEKSEMEYALAKVVREGSAADIAQAIALLADYSFVRNAVASAAE